MLPHCWAMFVNIYLRMHCATIATVLGMLLKTIENLMGCMPSPLLSQPHCDRVFTSLYQSLSFCSLDMQLTNCQLRYDSEVIHLLDFDPYWICSSFACHLHSCQSSACTVSRFGCLEEISARSFESSTTVCNACND